MIQLTKEQYKLLKELVKDAEPSSSEYPSCNGNYYVHCCDSDLRRSHHDDCPKMAWYKLESFIDSLQE